MHPSPRSGEVSPSYGDGGVMDLIEDAHDPSVRCADTSPRVAGGGELQSKKVLGLRKKASTRQPSSVQASCRLPARAQTRLPARQTPPSRGRETSGAQLCAS